MNTLNQLIDPSIANALGWTIIHSFWQASLIALVMSLIHRNSRNKNATFKYGIAVISMAFVLVMSAITFGLYYASPSAPTEVLATLNMEQVQSADFVEGSTLPGLQTFFTDNIETINLIWATGVFLFLVRFIFSYAYTKYLKNTAIFINTDKLEISLAKIKKNLLIQKSIEIAESAKIKVPVVLGHLKPIILFPVGIVNMLSTEEVDAIITHELAHIKRHDYLTNILLTLIEILFYFHPAVWWISANVKAERENCCDDFALSQNIDKVVYAKALVKLEELKSMGTPALAMPFSARKHQLINRIKRIMNMPQTQTDIKEKSIATILLLSMVLLFSNQANSDSPQQDAFLESKVLIDNTKVEGNEEMILKVKKGKFESLSIDNQIMENDFADKVAANVERNSNDKGSYTMIIKESPILEIMDDNIRIFGRTIDFEDDDNRYFSRMKADTIPQKRKNTSATITRKDGKTIEVEKENGVITELKIDGKSIPKSEYKKYAEEIESTENSFEFDMDIDVDVDEDENLFKHFDEEDFSKSFGLLFDGEKWREFGGNMNQFFDKDVFKKLEDMEGMRFDFKHFEDMEHLKGLEKLHELRGLENMEHLENLNEIFEELGIKMDSTFRGRHFNFDHLNDFKHFEFFEDLNDRDVNIFRDKDSGYRSGTVVDKIGRMLNQDGLLKEYKANKIEITGKHLKINGEKMPNAIFEKYKNIYQESTGAPLTKKSKMIFDVEGKPSKKRVKSF